MTAMTLFQSGTPAYLKSAELDETTKALMGGGGLGNRRISIKGNVFRMVVNGEEVATNEDRAMNIVVVAASPSVSRTYYKGAYVEGQKVSPVCWSADGAKPSEGAPDKQASLCAQCPQNIKGSGQGDSRACRFAQQLAVVLDGDVEGDVYQLTLPSTSVFGKGEGNEKLPLQAYVRLLATHNTPVTSVVTEMRFDTKSPVPKLTFRAVRYLEENEWNACRSQADSPEAQAAIKHEFTVKDEDGDSSVPFESPKPVPKAVAPKPVAPKPAPAPVVEEEAVVEPVKVSKKPAAPPAEKADLNDLLDEWADD